MITTIALATDYDLADESTVFAETIHNTHPEIDFLMDLTDNTEEVKMYALRSIGGEDFVPFTDRDGEIIYSYLIGGQESLTLADVPVNSSIRIGILVIDGTTGTIATIKANPVL